VAREAAIAAAVTAATGHSLVDAEDGVDLDAVVAADAADAVAADTARAVHAIFLHPSTRRHKARIAARTAVAIVAATAAEAGIRSAVVMIAAPGVI
jgi:hypothetical protein